jgi:WD40 repeat protein
MALAFLVILVLPLASSEDATKLDKYLDCLIDKKVDIVFVFDTTGSMEGEINELSAIARGFASDLDASLIDHHLGLVEFRDFSNTCDASKECGSQGDFPYKVKGDGNLTGDINTFNSWLRELKTGGGGGPEAVLAALRHAMTDSLWRSDAEKMIIMITDAPPHPDGDCCNAEGDTLDGTIFALAAQGVRVHAIGPDGPALKKIAGDTGGQFYKIRSGLSLKPLLKDITGAMNCSFQVNAEATCENRVLKAKVQLVGKEVIPYMAGQTEVWMYMGQAGSNSRYNLSYDLATGTYQGEVQDICSLVDLTVYGRVGERSAVQTVQVDCGSCGAAAATEQGTLSISGRVYNDGNGDAIKGADEAGLEGWDVMLEGPEGSTTTVKTDRKGYYIFTGLLPGNYGVSAATHENWTATASAEGVQAIKLVGSHESEIDFGFRLPLANLPPTIINLVAEPESPQDVGSVITWTADASDPDGDKIQYRYLLNDESLTDWTTENMWTWTPKNAGLYQIEVRVRDEKHAAPNGLDDRMSERFEITPTRPQLNLETQPELISVQGYSSSVAFSPDGSTLAVGWGKKGEKHGILLFDAETGREIRNIEGHAGAVAGIAFSPDGRTIASASYNGMVKLWDAGTGTEIRTLRGHLELVSSVAFSPDGRLIASGSGDNTVKLWDAGTGTEIRTLEGHSNPVTCVAFSPDGQMIASGDWDNTVKLWDAGTGTEIRTLRGHTHIVMSVAFSPDGQMIASGSGDNAVKLWDAGTGTEIRTLEGHSNPVTCVAFSPDGQMIASGSEDNAVKLWDAGTGTEIRTLKGHSNPVTCVAFSPDGRTLASGSNDGTIRLWKVA